MIWTFSINMRTRRPIFFFPFIHSSRIILKYSRHDAKNAPNSYWEREKNIYISRLTVNRLVYWMVIYFQISIEINSLNVLVKPYTDLRVATGRTHVEFSCCCRFFIFSLSSSVIWIMVSVWGHQNVSTISTIHSMAQQITGISTQHDEAIAAAAAATTAIDMKEWKTGKISNLFANKFT